LTVLGNACADRGFGVSSLPRPGETVLAHSVTQDLGGKGLNQAVAAARAGAVVRLVAPVGRDTVAALIADALRAETLDTEGLIACDGDSDGSIILTDDAGENVIVSDTRAAEALDPDAALAQLKLDKGDLLLLQGNLSEATTRAAIAFARAAGATVALNAAPLRDWLRDLGPDILIANRGEAAALAGMAETEDADMILARIDAPLTVITLGPGGCLLRADGRTLSVRAPQVAVRDTAGAGDVFCGVLLAEWLATRDLAASARLAILAASATVTRRGTFSAISDTAEITRFRRSISRSPS
jgi:ribokinase